MKRYDCLPILILKKEHLIEPPNLGDRVGMIGKLRMTQENF